MNQTVTALSATKDDTGSAAKQRTFPNSKKIYLPGKLYPDVRVPFREVTLSYSEKSGEPATCLIYDTSGPYTDLGFVSDPLKGLPAIRHSWIADRNDTETYTAKTTSAEFIKQQTASATRVGAYESLIASRPQPRRAKTGRNVSQMHYARQGIITPEMEFVAIRENALQAAAAEAAKKLDNKKVKLKKHVMKDSKVIHLVPLYRMK